jgi:hypothetical protein
MPDVRLREQLDALATQREPLTAALALGASHLEAAGAPPSDDLVGDLIAYQQQLQRAFRLLGP